MSIFFALALVGLSLDSLGGADLVQASQAQASGQIAVQEQDLVKGMAKIINRLELPTEWDWSMGSRLVSGADGQVYLSWVEGQEDQVRLRYSRFDGEGFGPARTAASGTGWMVNWADYPVLAVDVNGGMAATWLERSGDKDTWSYVARVSVSPSGEDWSDAILLHNDSAGPEYGFVSLVPLGGKVAGGFGAVWLDSRAMVSAEEGASPGAMALMYRNVSIGDHGVELGEEILFDDRTCDCCATTASPGENGGLSVAYRDRSTEEIRDIAVLHLDGEGAFKRRDPRADNWMIPGCPVNGPSLVRQGPSLGLAWFTMDKGLLGTNQPKPVVRAAFGSVASGFDRSKRVDLGSPIGRASAVMSSSGRMYVAWLENAPMAGVQPEKGVQPKAHWMLRDMGLASGKGRAAYQPFLLAEVPATRTSGFGSLVMVPEDGATSPSFLFAFTGESESGKTKVEVILIGD